MLIWRSSTGKLGAFDPDTNEAPVHKLSGLLRIADWLQALHAYDKDGDYGAFYPLLGPASELLAQAVFFERTSNAVKAREKLSSWASRDDRLPTGDPAATLFRRELEQRISWFRGQDRAEWEMALAQRYLKQGDYVRAGIFGLEAVISAKAGGNAGNLEIRAAAKRDIIHSGDENFHILNSLRNALAHGARPSRKIERLLREEKELRATLERLFEDLFGAARGQSASAPGS